MDYKFKTEPYEHQRKALRKCWDKPYYALFMDMGTGKSKVLIDNAAVLFFKKKIEGMLIVAPKGVYQNWLQKEIPAHMPDCEIKTVAWSASTTQRNLRSLETLFEETDALKILIMNVEAFSTKKGTAFAERYLSKWKCMLAVDESTTIKSKNARRTKSLTKLAGLAPYRRILTGSPVTRSPLDLFSQCEFLQKECLGQSSYWAYQNRYAKMIRRSVGTHTFNQIVGYQNLSELNQLLEPFSFRVRKEDCLDLPDKVYTKRIVELTAPQKEAYRTMKSAALAIIDESMVSAPTVLTQLLRLQQVCSGFVNMDDGTKKELPTNKTQELLSVVEEISGKAIIWGHFTNDILSIEKLLTDKYGEESCATFYGGTPPNDRQPIVDKFQDASSPLRFFIGQPRTGGYGLTLTEAKTVIYYSNGFDLEVRLQSEDRAHRIGQNNKVTYVDIVAEQTVDEKVLQALRSKIDISTQILAEGHKQWII